MRGMKLFTASMLLLGLSTLPGLTADDPPAKAPNFSEYADFTKLTAEVEKSDDMSITVKLPQASPSVGGGRSRRPMPGKTKWVEYSFNYVPEGMARWVKLPPKLDDNGKKVPYTQAEQAKFKTPSGVPGYAADRNDIHPGVIVELVLVRPKTVAKDKVKEEDLKIKYAMIVSDPSASLGSATKQDPPKK